MVECESTFLLISLILYRGFNRYMVECELDNAFTYRRDTLSFNRYMVECELFIKYPFVSFIIVLIDTWWNVNTDSICKWFGIQPVLIDTWWNVNLQ